MFLVVYMFDYDNLKEDYQTDILIFKKGNFYYVYNNDALIISFLFDYKIINNEIDAVVFPSVTKILKELKRLNIGYLLYDVLLLEREYGDSSIYYRYLNLAKNNNNKKMLIDRIVNILNNYNINQLEELITKLWLIV